MPTEHPAKSNEQQLIQLAPGAMQQFDQANQRHDAEIAQGVQPEELLKPAFWAHHALKLRPYDEIRARAIDGTWIATYVVLDTSRTYARVHQMSLHHLTTGQVAETQASEEEVKAYVQQHEIRYRGQHKYSIVRKGDSAVVEQGFADKAEATKRLESIARQHVGGAAAPKTAVTA